MRILQSGMPKSGNFWLWQILQEIIKKAGLPNNNFIKGQPIYPIAKTWELSFAEQADIDVIDITPDRQFYRISSIFRMPIDDFDDYLQQTNHVWTHSNFNAGSKIIFPKFDKIVYILRDPRDAIISQSRFAFTDYRKRFLPTKYENTEQFLTAQIPEKSKNWRNHVTSHLLHAQEYNMHIVFYEALLMNFDIEFGKLLAYLGVTLDSEQIAAIKQAVQFETMQKANPQHLAKGEAYKWMERMSVEQQKLALSYNQPLLKILGYPLTPQDASSLPSLARVNRQTLEASMKKNRGKAFLKRLIRFVNKGL